MRYQSDDFQGLTPAVDPRRSDKLFALAGQNYTLDALGPKSSFGNRFLTPYPIGAPQHTQGCRLRLRTGVAGADRVFTFVGDAILEWNEDSGGWRFIYVTGITTIQPYRWTFGYINGIMFFCHPAVGILAYTVDSMVCQPLVGSGVPEEPIAIMVNNGRLCVIDDLFFSWSAPGDGTNFVPTLGGAGFQKINDRVPGFPIMLTGYARGVLTWTTGGVMRSEFTGDATVYRHRVINTEYRPINSFCTLQMDDNTCVILDERGLFQSQGEGPTPLTPVFNEFLIDYLTKNNLKVGQNVRLEWDDLQRQLYLSVSLSDSDPLYEKAFVLYPSIDKWGTFDEPHYGIIPYLLSTGSRADDYFGFIDSDGRAHYWDYVGSREIVPIDSSLNAVYPLELKPAHTESGEVGTVLSSSMVMNTVNDILYTLGARGFYDTLGLVPVAATLTGLDSILQLGLVRAKDDNRYDRMIEVNNVFVGSVLSGESDSIAIDFNIIPETLPTPEAEDILDPETFSEVELTYVNHKLRIIGTMDGVSLFMDQVPELTRFDRGARHFSCSVPGIWHIVEIKADEVGEAYHIQSLELNAIDAGVLS